MGWYQPNGRYAATFALFYVCLPIVVIGTVFEGVKYGHWFHWMSIWWLWLLVLLVTAWAYVTQAVWGRCAVGADWLQGSRSWVRTYELVKVRSFRLPTGRMVLSMKDRKHRRLLIAVDTLLRDQLVWDLVYNGMLHSVVRWGADVNAPIHRDLKIPYPAE